LEYQLAKYTERNFSVRPTEVMGPSISVVKTRSPVLGLGYLVHRASQNPFLSNGSEPHESMIVKAGCDYGFEWAPREDDRLLVLNLLQRRADVSSGLFVRVNR
jgi:hypothetical protein